MSDAVSASRGGASGLIVFPATTDTLVCKGTTDIFTNKTLDGRTVAYVRDLINRQFVISRILRPDGTISMADADSVIHLGDRLWVISQAEDIEAGLWDGASIEIRQVNWASLSDGAEIVRVGKIGNIQRKRGQYVAEMRGLMQALQNIIVSTVQPKCDAVLGDARCGIDLDGSPTYRGTGTVIDITSGRAFTASGLAQAADYFTAGLVTFGAGAGV